MKYIRTGAEPHESCWKDGAANCTFVNLIINKVAAHLGMDPIKVQLLNDGVEGHDMAWLDENVKKRYGMPVRDSLKEVIEAGKAAFDWDKKWHPPGTRKLPNGKMHGVGFYAVSQLAYRRPGRAMLRAYLWPQMGRLPSSSGAADTRPVCPDHLLPDCG